MYQKGANWPKRIFKKGVKPIWKFELDQNFPDIPNPGSNGFHVVPHGWLPTEIGKAKTRNLVLFSCPPSKRPQTSDNPPRSGKIEIEIGRTYLTYVCRLLFNRL